MADFGFAIHQLSAQVVNGQNVASVGISDELKSAIATEVRVQMVPVVKEIVREVVSEVRNVMTEMVTPLYDELRDLRSRIPFPNHLLYPASNMGLYSNSSSTSQAGPCNGLEKKVEKCDGITESSPPINRSKTYEANNFSSKSQDEYFKEPREPRAQASTSDCAAFSFIYYNTVCLIPISTLLEPEKFAAHMKTRKYFVKDGQITGRIQQFGQVCHLLQDYDYILHRQYYCHGNTIGPAAIRKNIWYLTGKLNGGQVVGCALISYEIDDNATVKISKLRYKSGLNCVEVKEEVPAEEIDDRSMLTPNAELQSVSAIQEESTMVSPTEMELLAMINDMGYDLSADELIFFKKEMDQFLNEMEREEGQQLQDSNVSFSSLTRNLHSADCDVPYRYDKDELFYAEQYHYIPSYEKLELHEHQREVAQPSTAINHDKRLDYDEIVNILDDGYRCLRKITEDNSRLQDLNDRLEQSLCRSRVKLLSSDENKKTFTLSDELGDLQERIDEKKSNHAMIGIDPAIRPVLHPLPGGVPFRHDPVKKYELYKKEWTENPPPGENKRLSLRWKIREFMLRRDVPNVKPIDLARRRISNPDWCPRPYLS
uniref:Centriolar and ciliogenesis-associated protein HYLS1 C-terminal domain-containing protein n=1 Tax=Setaria digitata TaxID=48799 RepID=A0A915PQW7_9BILA